MEQSRKAVNLTCFTGSSLVGYECQPIVILDESAKPQPQKHSMECHKVVRTLEADWLPATWSSVHVLVAVSGGADSVALLRGLLELKTIHPGDGMLYAAHFNHRLRGAEADHDAAWVISLCDELGIKLASGSADSPISGVGSGGLEASARQQRYQFLKSTAERLGARFVVTGHHWDDQVETILHHILRGTGLSGLAGMPKNRPLSNSVTLMRPLLSVQHEEILDYLHTLQQEYVNDGSNTDTALTRNRIRHSLLPFLKESFNANVDQALLKLAAQAAEAQQFVGSVATELLESCVQIEFDSSKIVIDVQSLANMPGVLSREVCKLAWQKIGWSLQAMGYEEWFCLQAMLSDANSQKVVNLPEKVRAERLGNKLTLAQLS